VGNKREPAGPEPAGGGQDEILQQVSEVVLAVARQLSAHDALQLIVTSARSLVAARYAALGVPDDDGGFAEFIVDGIPDWQRRAIGPLPRQHGLLGVLLREGQPLRLEDIRADPRFEGWPAAHPDLSDVLGMPIRDGTQVLGVIFAASKRGPGGFTERDERLLALLASHAAIALTSARLHERGRKLSVLEERARLARELHDAVSQKLFSIRAKASAAALLVPRDPDQAVAEMRSVAALSGEAHGELRAVIDGLVPPELSAGGLAASLRSYAGLAGRAHGVAVTVCADEIPALGTQQETAVYRVAQEALTNALRHSGASRVCVLLTASRGQVLLEVADRGQGFADGVPPAGLGLASMRERAAAVGGELRVRSAPGEGTVVRLSVPAAGPDRGGADRGRADRGGAAAARHR
jgi:signal transduction histidine kinase